MEWLIRKHVDEYNINTVNKRLKYDFNIRLYYYKNKNNIIYLKTQYNLLMADRSVLCTLLYRRLYQCYKKEFYYIYKNSLIYNNQPIDISDFIKVECFYIVNLKQNIKIMPLAYYDFIYQILSRIRYLILYI